LAPVLPESTAKIWSQLGMTTELGSLIWDELRWGQYPANQKIGDIAAVFPRIEAAPAIEQMRVLEQQVGLEQAALLGKPAVEEPPAGISPIAEPISIDDFGKVDLRVGQVISAEPVKGSDKLLHLKVDIGEAEARTIVAGISQVYKPDQMVGRKIVIVANLEPRKLRGILSQGMIVAASLDGGKPVLAGFLEDVPVGARLK
jgi:methionyl-tRNA synthetase